MRKKKLKIKIPDAGNILKICVGDGCSQILRLDFLKTFYT